ncbi:MAG: hypothetical protein LKI80_06695 [Sporolactobacillus sp.]|jgi:magnesium-transporting ATPase (P-type)|nr:hypothetical protein [Sporolactobacillus sp.]
MAFYRERILHDQKIWLVFVLVLLIVNSDLWFLIVQRQNLVSYLNPFLAASSIGHYAHRMISWLLPAYLFLGPAGWYERDHRTGLDTIVIPKLTKNRYFQLNLWSSFLTVFIIFLVVLTVNFVISTTVFANGTGDPFGGPSQWKGYGFPDLILEFAHPIIANFAYIFAWSLLAGLYSALISAFSFVFPKRSYMFFIAVLLWFIAITGDYSVLLAVQPFTEYAITFQLILYAVYIASYSLLIYVCYRYVVKRDVL